jgi:hypothetical protein
VPVPRGLKVRRLHKAFLRYHDANNWPLLRDALHRMGREDLIGSGPECLVPPGKGKLMANVKGKARPAGKAKSADDSASPARPAGGKAKAPADVVRIGRVPGRARLSAKGRAAAKNKLSPNDKAAVLRKAAVKERTGGQGAGGRQGPGPGEGPARRPTRAGPGRTWRRRTAAGAARIPGVAAAWASRRAARAASRRAPAPRGHPQAGRSSGRASSAPKKRGRGR